MSEPSQENPASVIGKINLEMLIAFCAVIISVASFYATYLQANAAEKQVTAMTLPLMNFITSNINTDTKEPTIAFTLSNKGVGPAKIETFLLKYQNRFYTSPGEYLKSCCEKEWTLFREKAEEIQNRNLPLMITSDPTQQIIPSGDEIEVMILNKHQISNELWQATDKARRNTEVTACYCSLLNNCYWLTGNNQISDTPSCRE